MESGDPPGMFINGRGCVVSLPLSRGQGAAWNTLRTKSEAVPISVLSFLMAFGSQIILLSFFQFWDYRQPRKYLSILPCQVPVWKARYTVSDTPRPAGDLHFGVPEARQGGAGATRAIFFYFLCEAVFALSLR